MLRGAKMIFIPGGTFRMGDRGDIVTVDDFWMDETPVTVAQYLEAVKVGACTPPGGKNNFVYPANYVVAGRENHPVNYVDFVQACAYAKWVGKRLPTEEEWEWAARGGNEARTYPWGNEPPSDQLCWNGVDNDLGYKKRKSTTPVGSYPKGDSYHGLKDMSGNVWEWTSSNYESDSKLKVGRGGSWIDEVSGYVSASFRISILPSSRDPIIGFRCVRDA